MGGLDILQLGNANSNRLTSCMTQSYGCLPYGKHLTNSEEQEPVGDLENLSTRLGLPVWRCECETIVSASVQWERLDKRALKVLESH